jgi:hypothetical protein
VRSHCNGEEVHLAKERYGEEDYEDYKDDWVFMFSASTERSIVVFPAAILGYLRVVMHKSSKAWGLCDWLWRNALEYYQRQIVGMYT